MPLAADIIGPTKKHGVSDAPVRQPGRVSALIRDSEYVDVAVRDQFSRDSRDMHTLRGFSLRVSRRRNSDARRAASVGGRRLILPIQGPELSTESGQRRLDLGSPRNGSNYGTSQEPLGRPFFETGLGSVK